MCGVQQYGTKAAHAWAEVIRAAEKRGRTWYAWMKVCRLSSAMTSLSGKATRISCSCAGAATSSARCQKGHATPGAHRLKQRRAHLNGCMRRRLQLLQQTRRVLLQKDQALLVVKSLHPKTCLSARIHPKGRCDLKDCQATSVGCRAARSAPLRRRRAGSTAHGRPFAWPC